MNERQTLSNFYGKNDRRKASKRDIVCQTNIREIYSRVHASDRLGFTSYGNDRQTRDFLKSGPALVTRKQKKYRPIKMAWISESIRSYRGHDHIVQDHLSHNELAMATCRILL